MLMIIEHIPRTIHGIKFCYKDGSGNISFNVEMFLTKKEQLEEIDKLKSKPELYSDIKELKWLIKPYNDDE